MARIETLEGLLEKKDFFVAPGVFSPAAAQAAERIGFRAVYFSGAGFSNLMGLPDLGVTTLTEVARAVSDISTKVGVPIVADGDTGFGEAANVMRTMREFWRAGAAAVHIEDQVLPKKCGHLGGKELVETGEMVKKLAAGAQEERRPMLIARTDARAVEGLDSAIERARIYRRAGAEAIFPEALESRDEFAEFRRKVGGPLMANMTEFGKTPYMKAAEFEEMGYSFVIFPVTAFRAAMRAVWRTLEEIKRTGSQRAVLRSLMTRDEFNRLIGYDRYEKADRRSVEAARKLKRARD
jgi:methylisocitrate lyase